MVKPCFADYQKCKALTGKVKTARIESTSLTVIVCHSARKIEEVLRYLAPIEALVYDKALEQDERESVLLHAMHLDSAVLIVESRLMNEIPYHQFPVKSLNIIHWELPWSYEEMVAQTYPALHPNTLRLDSLVLFSKETYYDQRKDLKRYEALRSSKAVHLDHLNRVRNICLSGKQCRRIQNLGWIGEPLLIGDIPCQTCDVCLGQTDSSLWMNLLRQILY